MTSTTTRATTTHAPTRYATPQAHRRAWWGVAAAVFAIAWGGNEFTPLLVMYKNDGLPGTAVDLLLFYYVLGIVPALLIGGPLSDRFGRRALLLPAPLIAATASLLLACGADSVPLLGVGRVLSGVALGLAMAVGGSWLKELSEPGRGPRRSAMSLTGGFAIGAGVAGVLAQWGPLPDVLPYLVNVTLCLGAAAWIADAPETVVRQQGLGRLRDDLKIPGLREPRFRKVVLPTAVWVFACSATAYAVLPSSMAEQVPGAPIAFSALLTVITLGCGFAIQSAARRIDRPGTARASAVGLLLVTVGLLVAAFTFGTLTLWAAILTTVVLGAAYGITLVAGLQEVDRMAGPRDLAGLTAVFYSLAYLGFGLPALLSFLTERFGLGYPVMYLALAAVAACCLPVVLRNYRD
ncbi:MFS transporter [Nocardia higoensis]|uniref:MFS transporter n=1 Tax=Nocardia higoensis TaxID=228599 RepID=UPI000A053945|nr:MFS transporter [Nocardia higoensis]